MRASNQLQDTAQSAAMERPTEETSHLIACLAADCATIGRLQAPWRRTALWLMCVLPCVATVSVRFTRQDVMHNIDTRMVVEQAAILLTGFTAAFAAFSTVVPGRDWRVSLLPLIPLAVWLGSLGEGCMHDWARLGADGLRLRSDWDCVPAAIALGVPSATSMLVMLRRGAPLVPSLTLALGALASAAIVNFGLRLIHAGDVAVMVLAWHLGGVAVVTALAGRFGGQLLNWPCDGAGGAPSR
jgi:hypothetical protein